MLRLEIMMDTDVNCDLLAWLAADILDGYGDRQLVAA